ncbi:TIGR02680 family protein [Streptomyces sp. NBC_00237]|uniref:TIGR02680 family protein n=1 Tax=Streptomyces sp. NBC_00237 TaxID=2975687 RepID=UPI0022577F4B|nr:TIGR02680 family protein [Streptomyces sp. NBC_00237]MCX5203127.1 TIGR02680 family protein [Streptomyces sp. NBC_00237]
MNHRYRLHRAGIRNIWQYDEQEFAFGDGRLLLRGKNGAGKSKALEMLLPYLLDGDARALDATGTGRTTLAWLMLDGIAQTNRLGYLWVEFHRQDEAGTDHYLTLGAAVRASRSTGVAKPFFFATPLRVGNDLHLVEAGQPLPIDRLREQVGAEHVLERAVDHRARVARELFGLSDPARFRNLTHLLHRLRRPTIGDRIEAGGLITVLSETLPALDDEVVEKVARNLDDLDAVREDLGRLERTDAALGHFLTSYRGYLHGALRRRAADVGGALGILGGLRRAAGAAAQRTVTLRTVEDELAARLETLRAEHATAVTDLDALHASAGYQSLKELGEKRSTVAALHSAATVAFKALRQAHTGEREAAGRLTAGAEQLGADLRELGTSYGELRGDAERSGLDPVHLGDPVAAAAVPAAAAQSTTLTDPDGMLHVIRHARAVAVDTGACADSLGKWAGQLAAAAPVIRTRGRTVTELSALLAKSQRAEREALEADTAREQLEEQAEHAAGRVHSRRQETAHASAQYAHAVRSWAARLESLADPGVCLVSVRDLVGRDEAADAPLDEQTLPAEVADAVAEAAEQAMEPVLARLSGERDALALRTRELATEQDRIQREKEAREQQQDPQPPRTPYRDAPRASATGAPLYRLVDFAEDLAPAERAGVEAALEASGLLDAWITAQGVVVDPATRDTLLVPGNPVDGPALDRALRPVAAPGSGVSAAQVTRVLASVALHTAAGAPPEASPTANHPAAVSAIGTDGTWVLGVARGRHTKTEVEYVGAEVRAETRRRIIADLARRLALVQEDLQAARMRLRELTARRDEIEAALRRSPKARDLTDAWARTSEAERTAGELAGRAAKAAREAEKARGDAVAVRRQAEAMATAHDLPADPAALEEVRAAGDRLRRGAEQLHRRIRAVAASTEGHRADRDGYDRSRDVRATAESDYAQRSGALNAARRTIQQLEEAMDATEAAILARENETNLRLEAVSRQLPALEREVAGVHDDRITAEVDERTQRDKLTAQETEVITCGAALRTALSMPEVTRGAGLDREPRAGLTDPDPAHEDVRTRIKALSHLVDTVKAVLGVERDDISDTSLLNRSNELRDKLSGGYDALLEERDGIKVCRLVDDHGSHDIAQVGARIAAQAAEARQRLTDRERDVFQRFLTGELGDNLSSQVLAASTLVDALNGTLRTVRTSHGLGVELDWRLADTAEADVRAAVELLRSPSGLRTREQTEQLRDVLQRRIEDARRTDPAAGYAAHLRTALDYRTWFTFTPWVVDDAAPGRKRRMTGRTGLSQGEQRVLSYLVLFAAAAAHFTTLAETAPHAPRLILLDDAFAKVDEPTHGRLGRILVDLDLDFVLTSERLIGNWPDVPSLHIYECLRDPHTRGVATLHYTWNGRQRRLMSV